MNHPRKSEDLRIRILLVGRIYEEEEIFKIIKIAVIKFASMVGTVFYFMDKRTIEKIQLIFPNYDCQIFDATLHANTLDFVLTFGGDGTILYAAKEFQSTTPPFLSFQRGTLGFLCKFTVQQINYAIEQAVTFHGVKSPEFPFRVSELMRIEGQVFQEKGGSLEKKVCLNEIAITRSSSNRIILEIFINSEQVTETSGDGLLISTPTGSTAYALSAGGPVVEQATNSILIVPIAPNSLSFRPICLSAENKIRVRMSSKSRVNGLISFDGQTHVDFKAGDFIEIEKSKSCITFYEPRSEEAQLPTWMQRLTQFLGWNETFKSPKFSDEKMSPPKISLRSRSEKAHDQVKSLVDFKQLDKERTLYMKAEGQFRCLALIFPGEFLSTNYILKEKNESMMDVQVL